MDLASLRLTGVKGDDITRTTVTIDPHVGFDFAAPGGAGGQGHIFLRDPLSDAFVELSIDLSSGRLCGATTVGTMPVGANVRLDHLPTTHGLPIFGAHGFDRDAVMPAHDVVAALSVVIGSDTILLCWTADLPDARVTCGRAMFLFLDQTLVGMGAQSLTAAEIKLARQTLVSS